jgi:hypothetical protein
VAPAKDLERDAATGQQIGSNHDPTGNNTQGCVTVVFCGTWAQATQSMKASQPPNLTVGVAWISASSLRWKNRGKSSNMPTPKITTEILNAAILGMEAQKEKLDAKIAELRAWLSGGPTEPTAAAEPPKRKRRKMSAAARKRIGDAQRKRWAASKKAAQPSIPEAAPKKKRKLSAAGRKAIIAATKKRWEAVRAAKAQQEKAAARKPAKKAAVKKAAVKAPPAKAAKKSAPVKKAAMKTAVEKKTAPAAAPAPGAAAQ